MDNLENSHYSQLPQGKWQQVEKHASKSGIHLQMEVLQHILPFYGYVLEWRHFMTNLHTHTNTIWRNNRLQFLELQCQFPARFINIYEFDQEAGDMVLDPKQYYYFKISLRTEKNVFDFQNLIEVR